MILSPGSLKVKQRRRPLDKVCVCSGEWTSGSNILGLITFAIILGVSLAKLGEKGIEMSSYYPQDFILPSLPGKPLLAFFTSLSDAMMVITTWVINLAPVGVFFLIGGQVLGTQDFGVVLNQLGWYFSTVMLGLFMHGFIVLPLIYTLVTRSLPFRFIGNMTNAFTTAFGNIETKTDTELIIVTPRQEPPPAAPLCLLLSVC